MVLGLVQIEQADLTELDVTDVAHVQGFSRLPYRGAGDQTGRVKVGGCRRCVWGDAHIQLSGFDEFVFLLTFEFSEFMI